MNYLMQISTKTMGELYVLLKYNEFGDLVLWELRNLSTGLTSGARTWLHLRIPYTTADLEHFSTFSRIKFQVVEDDLSFDTFYDLYSYKVGNKDRAKKAWNKLDDTTRILALKKVKEYNYYMATATHAKIFPERWLGQRRWENDYATAR